VIAERVRRIEHWQCCVWRRVSLALWLGCALTLACSSGCNRDRGPERVVVSGAVTYQGKPIPEGRIRFTPLPNFPVPVSGASIADGKYKVDGHGGVPVGTHKVQIEAYHKVAVKPGELAPPMSRGFVGRQYLPKKYNDDTQIEIKVEPGSRDIVKNFELAD
jgi:hypothetical protein